MFSQLAHWGALVPLFYLLAFRREAPPAYWLLALAFSVSFFAGLVSIAFPQVNWAVTHFYPAVQISLFSFASSALMGFAMLHGGIVCIVIGFFVGTGFPELAYTGIGSICAMVSAREKRWVPILWMYCGVATIFYALLSTEVYSARFMLWWYPYQVARLASFGLFVIHVRERAGRSTEVGARHRQHHNDGVVWADGRDDPTAI